jgi:hypothetical protein
MYAQPRKLNEAKKRADASFPAQNTDTASPHSAIEDHRSEAAVQMAQKGVLQNAQKRSASEAGNRIVQTARGRGGHLAQTYVVDVSHRLANGGNPVQYYRDNVQGHPAQRAVIAAAVAAFAIAYPATVGHGAPTRGGHVAHAGAPVGAIPV